MRPWALVTGASLGIGLELARLCAADGHDVVLVARNRERLNTLATELATRHGGVALALALDLSTADAAERLAVWLAGRGIVPQLLINNAGFGLYGLYRATPLAVEEDMLRLNVATLTSLTKRLLPAMLARGSGRIMNVASTAAFLPGPWMAVYYATKAYVLSYSEALAWELAGTGLTVTALCPGPVATGFQARAGLDRSGLRSGKWLRMDTAADVARTGYRALLRGRRVCVPGARNALMAGAARLLPRRLLTAAVGRLSAPR